MTITCGFRDRLGLILDAAARRIEILEVSHAFDGTDGVVATGRGRSVAALTPSGLTAGQRCRESPLAPPRKLSSDMIGPWPEVIGSHLACWFASNVVIDARTTARGGRRLTVGTRATTYIRAELRRDRKGGLLFSFRHCRRFDVTGRLPP